MTKPEHDATPSPVAAPASPGWRDIVMSGADKTQIGNLVQEQLAGLPHAVGESR
ncbi:hypothetical protein O4H53_10930 [Sulfitobacter sp. G21635-S1]|uniref:hypothetical protein n=1 Tax=Sulfitobacter sp. G21635-S1 TaxID=3014043 RepID=UPI0022AF5C15|nr:hypothetical protein [Sulfitobacter sp. G21635-S1]MCZ4256055.1 hypothetical protein [Sulfitobacter sp. G21635-S1]